MKTIQLSLQVADDITSINQLERYVNHLGQQIKRQLFTNMLAQLAQSESQSDSSPSTCPNCQKTETMAWGNRPRVLKTVFGPVHFRLPRQKCRPCQHTFSLSKPGLELNGSNVTSELRKIAILCASSWPFRQAANVLLQLTGVELSFSHIRWLCANQAEIVRTQDQTESDQVEWEALAETTEVLVESLVDQPRPPMAPSAHHPSVQPTYIGIDGTFINAQPAKRFLQAKAAIIFTNHRVTVSKGRNVLQNKRYVGTCLSVSELSQKLFSCARKMGVTDQSRLIILADGARWISQLAQRQYPKAKLILDWWHLKKRLWQTVDWLKRHGLPSKDSHDWAGQISDWLWRGKVGAALQSCIDLGQQMGLAAPADKSQTQLGESSLQSFYLYLRNNFNSIVDYHGYRKKGCYISSVLVEKTIDLLVCRRLKLRGQNWSRPGADNLLLFRQMMLNDQWQDYWSGGKIA